MSATFAGGADLGSAHGQIVIGADTRGLDVAAKALADFDKQAQSAGQGLDAISTQRLNGVARSASVIGLGLAAPLVGATTAAIGFQAAMANVNSIAQLSAPALQELSNSVLTLANDPGIVDGPAKLADGLYDIESSGFAGADALTILSVAAKAATAGMTETSVASAAVVGTLNAYHEGADQASRVANILFQTVQDGVLTFDELANNLGKTTAAANALNIPFEDLGAAYAILTKNNIDASAAETDISALMRAALKPTADLSAAVKAYGFDSAEALIKAKGLAGFIQLLNEVSGGSSTILNSLLGSTEAVTAAQILGANSTKDYTAEIDVMNHASDGAGAANRALGEQMQSDAFKMKKALQEIQTAGVEAGAAFLPVIGKIAEAVGAVARAFTSLSPETQHFAVDLVALAAGLALLVGAGAKVIAIYRSVQTVISVVRGLMIGLGEGAVAASAGTGTLAASQEAATASAAALGTAQSGAAVGIGAEAVAADGATIATGELALAEDGAAASAAALGTATSGAAATGGMAGMAAAAGTLATKLGVLALALFDAKAAFDTFNSLKSGGNPGVAGWFESGMKDLSNVVTAGISKAGFPDLAKSLNDQIQASFESIDVEQQAIDVGFTVDPKISNRGESIIKEIGKTVSQVKAEAAAANQTTAEYIQGLKDTYDAQKVVTDQKEADRKATLAHDAAEQDSIAATGKTLEQVQAEADAADAAAKANERFNGQLDNLTTNALIAQGSLVDIAPSLDGIQQGFVDADASALAVASALYDVGAVSLSKNNREALAYALALQKVEEKLATVDGEIKNNQEDMAMWSGRIKLVTDVLGGNSEELNRLLGLLQDGTITQEQFNAAISSGALGAFSKLDALLNAGKISQEQYNAAKTAGIHLIERSAGGIQDEDAELVQNLIDLDNYVTAHDNADGAINRLSDSQRGFIAAMGDARTQTFLQTLQLLEFLAATGAIPPEKVTKFIVDSGQANPVIQGVIDDLGLVEGNHDVNLTGTNANSVLDDLNGKVNYFVSLDGKSVTITADTKADALQAAITNADALDGKTVDVVINGDDGPVHTTLDQIRTDAGVGVTVPVTFQVTSQSAVTGFGGPLTPGGNDLATIPPVVTATVVTDDQSATGVDSAKANLATIPPAGTAAGTETGVNFGAGFGASASAGVAGGIATVAGALSDATTGLMTVANSDGVVVGDAFVAGFVSALANQGGYIYNAAFNVAFNAYLGAKAALGIASPSRRAQELAGNFGGTFGDSLAKEGRGAAQGAQAFIDRALQPLDPRAATVRSLFAVSGPPALPIGAFGGGAAGRTGGINLNVSFGDINGVTDVEAVGNVIVDKLHRTITRLQAGAAA